MGESKFFSFWHPLAAAREDARTALVFGFLRHAPVDAALGPWLREVLDADDGLSVAPLQRSAFWPDYDSRVEDSTRTQPELVFPAADAGEAVLVVVENKLYDRDHTLAQIWREVVDAVAGQPARRVEMILAGAHPTCPYPLAEWEREVASQVAAHGLLGRVVRLRYSSWATLGRGIQAAADSQPQWAAYAHDAAEQLKRNGLLGY